VLLTSGSNLEIVLGSQKFVSKFLSRPVNAKLRSHPRKIAPNVGVLQMRAHTLVRRHDQSDVGFVDKSTAIVAASMA
jgi:hypothetical protein